MSKHEKISTYTGIHMSPLDPKKEDICIEDIAHALSLMVRANGHFKEFYSVAQHCLDCVCVARAEGRSDREVLACLLHDASEAYLADITRPVKASMPEYRSIEKRLQDTIYEAFHIGRLTERELQIIKRIDDACLYYEFLHFKGERLFDAPPQIAVKPEHRVRSFAEVEEEFLAEFQKLSQGISR